MLGPPKTPRRDELFLSSLEQRLPADHFYRRLDTKLDLSFVRDWVADKYAAIGRPSIDPVVFFRLQLILFFEGLRSERKLIEAADLNIAHRWYLGYGWDEPLPDHSSLSKIRARLGLEVFERFFNRVVELCCEAGLVWGKELYFDGTKVQANAALTSLRTRWSVAARDHLAALFTEEEPSGPAPYALPPDAADAPEATPEPASAPAPAAPDPAAPERLPFPGTAEAEQQLAAENQAQWKLLDEHRHPPDERSRSRGYQRLSDDQVSTTDPDATPMRRFSGDRASLGYHDQYVVDGGKHRIILAAFVTPADIMDNTPMLDLYRRVCFRWQLQPERVVADAKFGTGPNLEALLAAGTTPYIPVPDFDQRTEFYGPSHFRYDPERDEYVCPQGQPLPFWREKPTEEVRVYRADAHTCWICPVRDACTASGDGRIIQRSYYADAIEQVKGSRETAAYKKAMRKRKLWPEPLFGEAKQWHNLRRFRLRGLWKVNTEALLVAAGQNLKRWLKATGWRGRTGPAGGLALAAFASLCAVFSEIN
ncbi:MAG TPA: IS1182 family transposase [Dehalococcoidia bacterium]|nr:IS1182 family transposase [Dehalococcoidia bacterium]